MKLFSYQQMSTVFILFFSFTFLNAQHFEIGRMEIDFIDHSREDRHIGALVLYPSDSSGTNVPLAQPVMNQYPVIVFGHGYLMPVEAYRNVWEWVVPEGFVFVLPQSGSGIFPSHLEFGQDMAFLLDEMRRLGNTPSSLFFGRVRSDGCLMGHSMGGGAAFLGALYSDAIATIVTLAPLLTKPSSAEAARELTLPSLIFAGTDDCINPPEKHQVPIYDSLQCSHKIYIAIQGGSHCQMASSNRLCNFAENSCGIKPGITREEQHRVLERYMLPWLKYYLYGDTASGNIFEEQLMSDTAINYCKVGSIKSESR